MKAGVLALQGDFREHASVFAEAGATPVGGGPGAPRLPHPARVRAEAGATPVEVRLPADLDGVDCLAIPGGESTTIGKLARAYDLVDPIRERARAGMPILGTCAGMIVLAREVEGGEALFGLMDISVRRNAYGRQVDSFEADIEVRGIDHRVRGVFIRAPWIERIGDGVEVLAEFEDRPVVLEQGNLLATSFHPELVGETGLHEYLLRKA